jgi:hypothetical protein
MGAACPRRGDIRKDSRTLALLHGTRRGTSKQLVVPERAGQLKMDLRKIPSDTNLGNEFPPPPIPASGLLVPIESWPEMVQEQKVTGVEFELFWYQCVADGVAYFFRWLGEPRSTVLVVWNSAGPTHIECRTAGDCLVSTDQAKPISTGVIRLFQDVGQRSSEAMQ